MRANDFTEDAYRHLLRLASSRWTFVDYADFAAPGRSILWRHDVDMSVHRALRLAEIESEEGVRSTYFLMLGSAFYNVFEPEVARRAKAIVQLGHRIGLHFDPQSAMAAAAPGATIETQLRAEKTILESAIGETVHTFTWHNPTIGDWFSADMKFGAGMLNAYCPEIRERFKYVSDSNGYWRHDHLHDVLLSAKHEKIHVLTHPEWWQVSSMLPRERAFRCLDGRTEAALKHYDGLLRAHGRGNLGGLPPEFNALRRHMSRDADALDRRWMRGEYAGVFLDIGRLLESRLARHCRIWLRREFRVPMADVDALFGSGGRRIRIDALCSAIAQEPWSRLCGAADEELAHWRSVREDLTLGIRRHPSQTLREGIEFLAGVAHRLEERWRTSNLPSMISLGPVHDDPLASRGPRESLREWMLTIQSKVAEVKMEQKRVRLRAVCDADSDLLYDWINDRDLLIHNAAYRPTAQENHRNWFRSITGRTDLVLFVIEDLQTQRAIGSCQLLHIHPVHRSAELQIRIAEPASQGKGLGSDAIAQLVEFGFKDLNLNRIALQVFATNARAIRAYEKNGFVHEGRLREAAHIDGKAIDVVCMARLRGGHA